MKRKPNILLITADQLRREAVLPHRPDWLRVPHMDWLARTGMSFRNAYTTCPICVPARTTIMSGQFEWTHGMTENGKTSDVLDDSKTLPSRLRGLGYQTMAIGKMHFGPQRCRHGFDDCLIGADYLREMKQSGNPLQPLRNGMGQNEYYPAMSPVPEAMTYTSWIADNCVTFMHERRDPTRPFFLWCSYGKPHMPFDPPEPYYSMYKRTEMEKPAHGDWQDDPDRLPRSVEAFAIAASTDLYPDELRRDIQNAYWGLVSQVDASIGRVLSALQDQDLLKDTLIVFTSDHGEFLGDFNLMGKCHWLEGAAHIPMLVKPPEYWGEDWRGMVRDELVCLADILPTFVSAAGSEAEAVDGIDIFAQCRGSAPRRDYLEGTGPGRTPEIRGKTHRAITDGRYKYLYYFEGPAELLFDLETDPREIRNLTNDPAHAEVKERLRQELIKRMSARVCDAFLVEDGQLTSFPKAPMPEERVLRSSNWLGLHTEFYQGDVFH